MNDERVQAGVQAAADELVACGAEIGLQVCVVKNGQVAADLVSGVADPRTGAAACGDTLFWAGSTAKGVASTAAHVLVERGELDYDMRAADVWPEFGSHGKDKVTLRHVLLHTVGVPGLPPGTTAENLCDWEHMCAVLATSSRGGSPVPASATTRKPSASCSARSSAGQPDARSRRSCER